MEQKTEQKRKKPTMQDEADRLFALQMRLTEKTKYSSRALIGFVLIFLFSFAVLIYAIPDKEESEQEGRMLQTFPKIQSTYHGGLLERIAAGKFLDRYFDGKFSKEIADYYADQFPARNFFVGLKGVTEIALCRGENNEILLAGDGYLLTRMDDDPGCADFLAGNVAAVRQFASALAEEDVEVTLAVAGRSIDMMSSVYPVGYPEDAHHAIWDTMDTAAEGLLYLNLRDVLMPYVEAGEAVMFRTDHHWTVRGAYYAYCAILTAWDMEPLPIEAFTAETASDAFYGTSWRKAGMKWIAPDVLEFYRWDGDEEYTTTIHDNQTSMQGFYDRSYLDKTDKYSAFISGNHAYVTIEKNNGEEQRPRLLLIKDSFGHSLAPFLAYHFDLEIVDPRYYNKNSTAELAGETGCDRVLIMMNMESMTTSAVLGALNIGIGAVS